MDDKTITTSAELSMVLRKMDDKVIIIPASGKFLKRYSHRVVGGVEEDTTLDYYYVLVVNDVLREIRKGRTGYIYNARQIADIKSFEPNAKFSFEDGAVAVRLGV